MFIDEFIKQDISNILIVADTNYYQETNCEVEMISENTVDCFRLIKLKDFLNKQKRLFYFKYDNIIIEQCYLNQTLSILSHYFNDKNFSLYILLDKDYKIESNNEILSLFNNKAFNSQIIERKDGIIILISR